MNYSKMPSKKTLQMKTKKLNPLVNPNRFSEKEEISFQELFTKEKQFKEKKMEDFLKRVQHYPQKKARKSLIQYPQMKKNPLNYSTKKGVQIHKGKGICLSCHFKYEEEQAFSYLPKAIATHLKREHQTLKARGYPKKEVLTHAQEEMKYFRQYVPEPIMRQIESDYSQYKRGVLLKTCPKKKASSTSLKTSPCNGSRSYTSYQNCCCCCQRTYTRTKEVCLDSQYSSSYDAKRGHQGCSCCSPTETCSTRKQTHSTCSPAPQSCETKYQTKESCPTKKEPPPQSCCCCCCCCETSEIRKPEKTCPASTPEDSLSPEIGDPSIEEPPFTEEPPYIEEEPSDFPEVDLPPEEEISTTGGTGASSGFKYKTLKAAFVALVKEIGTWGVDNRMSLEIVNNPKTKFIEYEAFGQSGIDPYIKNYKVAEFIDGEFQYTFKIPIFWAKALKEGVFYKEEEYLKRGSGALLHVQAASSAGRKGLEYLISALMNSQCATCSENYGLGTLQGLFRKAFLNLIGVLLQKIHLAKPMTVSSISTLPPDTSALIQWGKNIFLERLNIGLDNLKQYEGGQICGDILGLFNSSKNTSNGENSYFQGAKKRKKIAENYVILRDLIPSAKLMGTPVSCVKTERIFYHPNKKAYTGTNKILQKLSKFLYLEPLKRSLTVSEIHESGIDTNELDFGGKYGDYGEAFAPLEVPLPHLVKKGSLLLSNALVVVNDGIYHIVINRDFKAVLGGIISYKTKKRYFSEEKEDERFLYEQTEFTSGAETIVHELIHVNLFEHGEDRPHFKAPPWYKKDELLVRAMEHMYFTEYLIKEVEEAMINKLELSLINVLNDASELRRIFFYRYLFTSELFEENDVFDPQKLIENLSILLEKQNLSFMFQEIFEKVMEKELFLSKSSIAYITKYESMVSKNKMTVNEIYKMLKIRADFIEDYNSYYMEAVKQCNLLAIEWEPIETRFKFGAYYLKYEGPTVLRDSDQKSEGPVILRNR